MKYSKDGYKRNSKDKNNPYNVIPSGNITMKGVDFPVMGTDNLGNQKLMMPGANYIFPGNEVFEVPLQNLPRHFQDGGFVNVFQDNNPQHYNHMTNTIYINPEDVEGPQPPFIGEHEPDHVLRHELEHYYQWEDTKDDEWPNMAPLAPYDYDMIEDTSYFNYKQDNPLSQRFIDDKEMVMKDMYLNVLDPERTNFWMQNMSIGELMEQTAFDNEAIPQLERQVMKYPANVRDYMLNQIRNDRVNRIRLQAEEDVYNDPRTLEGQARMIEDDGRQDAHIMETLKHIARENQEEGRYENPNFKKEFKTLTKEQGGGELPKAQLGKQFLKGIKKGKNRSIADETLFRGLHLNDKIRNLPMFKGLTDEQILRVMATTIPGRTGTKRKNQFDNTMNFGRDRQMAEEHIHKFTRSPIQPRGFRIGNTPKDEKGLVIGGDNYIVATNPFDDIPIMHPDDIEKLFMASGSKLPVGHPDRAKEILLNQKAILDQLPPAIRTEGINVNEGNFHQFVGQQGVPIGRLNDIIKLKKQKGGEEESEWETKKYGKNKKKYKPAKDWSEYEDYDYKDKKYKRRYFDINRNELDHYLKYKDKSIFKDVRMHSKQEWPSLVDNTKGNMRVRETLTPSGRQSYTLEYKGDTGWRTYARGSANSGLANLTPDYLTDLKKRGRGSIGQYSSWFDMTPKERKEYGREEWIGTGFQRDLRFDKEGNTWSGWKHRGDKTPLHYTLRDEDLQMLPGSIKEKYNLIGKDHLRQDPGNGEIYVVNDRGSIRSTINQKDMKWFQNPGRLAGAYNDPGFNYKHDNLLDYINNPDFRYYKDSQTVTLDPITIDGVPTSPPTLPTRSRYVPKPAGAAYTETKPYGSGANPNMQDITLTPQMQEERDNYTSFQNTLPENLKTDDPNYNMKGLWDAMGQPENFKEAKKSDYWGAEGWVPEPYDSLYHGPSVGADGWLLKSDKHDTFNEETDWLNSDDPAAEYQKENFNLVQDDTGHFGKNQWRYVPKVSETVEELMGQLKNTQGSSKINVSGQAILDATKRENYSNENLMRDLRIFKDAYGQENSDLLQKMLQKSEAPKAKYGAELIRFQSKGEVEPGIMAERLKNSVTPIGYSLDHALKEFIAGEKLPFEWDGQLQTWENFGENLNLPPEQSDYIKQSSQDLWNKYLGFEPENNTISESLFSPSIAGLKGPIKEGKKYFSFNWDDDIWEDVINYEFIKKRSKTEKEVNNIHIKDSSAGGFAMNNYKISKGFDKERKLPYVSYYDEFDFDIPLKGPWQMAGWLFGEKGKDGGYTIPAEKLVGKPFELYGRMYYDPDNVDLDGNPLRISDDRIDNYHVDYDKLKVGIMATESANGQLLENPESTATGLYGQRFSELDSSDIFLGSRSEFAEDFAEQDKIFKQRFDGSLFDDQRGLKTDANEVYNEYVNQTNIPYNKTEIAALINFIGRQGAREYLGYVLRDGKSLEEVFPNLYGENAEQRNKTPEQYINSFRKATEEYSKSASYEDYILNNLPKDIVEQLLLDYTEEQIEEKQFSLGGEYEKTDKKIERLQQQLEKYQEGGQLSGIIKDELFEYGLIDDGVPKLQKGGESYTVQKDDSLSEIARDHNMSLVELLELNPEYKAKPGEVRTGAKINISSTPISDTTTPEKGYDNFKTFSEAFGQARKDLGKNKIFSYKGSQFRTNLKGEAWIPSEFELEKNGLNNDISVDRIEQEETLVDSVYSDKNTPDYEDAVGPWRNVERKINNNKDINKLQNVEKILFYEMENAPEQNIEELTYTVKPNDFLGGIANENMTSINQILVDNGIDEDTHIHPGQKLIIKRPSGNPFLVVDKVAGKTHLYYPGQNKPTRSYNVLLGEKPGDQQTVTKPVDINQDGQINDDDKVWKNGKRVWTYDWSAGNMQTGAGIFTISNVDPDSGYWDETGQNRNVPSFNLTHEGMGEGENISMSIHGIPSTVNWMEQQERKKSLYSKSADDNRQSYGCINMKCGDLTELLGSIQKGTSVYVLPENSGVGDWQNENRFQYQDGQIVFKGALDTPLHPDDRVKFEQWKKDNPYEEWKKKEKKEKGSVDPQDYLKSYPDDLRYSNVGWYEDDEGNIREGQGIMRSINTIKYHPVSISIDKNKIQNNTLNNGEPLDYNSHAAQEEMEFQRNTQPYLNALVNNKKQILNVLQEVGSGVPSDIYDMIIPTSFGVYGVESGMGNINPEVLNMGLGLGKASGYTDTNPDVIRKYHSYGPIGNIEIDYKGNKKKLSAQGPYDSVGWTQIKWDVSLDDMEKKILNKLGITEQKDFMDPQKSAIATQAILTYRYNSRTESLTPEEKSDQDFVRNYLAQTWNPEKENYSERVSNYYDFLDIYSLDVADVNQPGKVDVQGEYEPRGFLQESLNWMLQPFPNAPYSHEVELPKGHQGQDKIGKDNMFGVGTPKMKHGGAKEQSIPGGSFDLTTQIRIYNEYIDGNFDNTIDEKGVKNFIDKINRLYYTDAKKKGRHIYDHIRKL